MATKKKAVKKAAKKKASKKTTPAAPVNHGPFVRDDGVKFDRADLQQAHDGRAWVVTMRAGGAYVDRSASKVPGVAEAPQ